MLEQVQALSHWQIDLLAFTLLLQGCLITIFPEEVIFLTLGVLWSQGRVGFFEALVSGQLGLLGANAALVSVGHHLGARALSRRPLSWLLNKDSVTRARQILNRHGTWIVFVARFTPLVRGPVYFAVGLSKLGVLRFMRTDALASCFHLPLLMLTGAAIGRNSASIVQAYHTVGLVMAFITLSGVALVVFNRLRSA